MRGRISNVVIGFALVCAVTSLVSFAGGVWWPLDLLSHFRVQLAIVVVIATIVLLIIKRRKLACIALAIAVIHIADVGRLYLPSAAASDAAQDAPTLKLLHFNAWSWSNRDPAAFVRYLESSDVDLAFVQESNEDIVDCLKSMHSGFELVWPRGPYQHGEHLVLRKMRTGSPIEVISVERCRWGRAIDVRIKWQGRIIAILNPHITIPGSRANALERNAEFAVVAEWARAQQLPSVIIGDLNATPWCSGFRSLLAETKLIDSQQGFGVQGSWPRRPPHALSWIFTIPIDHCLHDANWVTLDRRIGPYLGSDHLPLEVTVQLID